MQFHLPEVSMKYPSLALACFGLLSVAISPIAQAEFKCDQPQLTRVDATACAKAAESPSSVRQYIWRTRMIYGLQMSDYVRFLGDEPKAGPARAAQATPQDSVAGVARPLR
jgi:hypothetical protein